jgi:hypothetical protein
MSTLQQFYRERALLKRLLDHGVAPFMGVSTAEQRRDVIRRAIQTHELAAVIFGRSKERGPITYEQAYTETYGEPL